ncbi:UDP-2,4-diacetamido-2,4,6-trideoxy-beta-L-altropyranose hydrolase [Salinivibrio sp. MA351]|uniref:UDP-2,4-diacetamido-2,4, 6-trideoxy-beta-L-altropyranose hydrolase n=1 Tax=Salinivibrio sp. MA351 TaxID=1909453 RepID=UPI000988B325|nr:UDP-2,4-diacetamido-2,4,6-trideoxy-beta-L-altropyranose hydrolase [Salinivibrio sp. MA351]OOE99926.1 UDP-2,4-diacetamido-2,4,6-trideoxy-beta-L-altropyranose hydrolase [Salinivibrio sp. MA351]
MSHIAIRVDASQAIGTGHVSRMHVLASMLQTSGHQVTLVCRDLPGNLIAVSHEQGLTVAVLPAPKNSLSNTDWLGVSQRQDAEEATACVANQPVDLMVVDHYALDARWEQSIHTQLGCPVMVVDDLANRPHDCAFLLDQNPWPDFTTRYVSQLVNPQTRCLLGPYYALLRPAFAALHQSPPPREDKVIAFFSGTDPTGESRKLVDAVKHLEAVQHLEEGQKLDRLPFSLLIVTGRRNPDRDALCKEPVPDGVSVVEALSDFDTHMARARYAFGAAGVTAIERSCLGVPSTLVCVAENQHAMAEYLAGQPGYQYLGRGEHTRWQDYASALQHLAANWYQLPTLPAITDGKGAERVVAALEHDLCN